MLNLLIELYPLKNINIYCKNTSSLLNKYLNHDVKNIYEKLSSKSYSVEWRYRKHYLINTGPPV